MIRRIKKYYSTKARLKRGEMFNRLLSPHKDSKILDLGGWDGSHIHSIAKNHYDITIADISEASLKIAREKYSYKTILIDESEKLNFSDKEFDIVFCNSVIEHVTLPKTKVWNFNDTEAFKEAAMKRQKQFADEIRRIGKSYFVQTPYKYFIIESHSWLPIIIVFLSRPILIKTLRLFNKFWFKRTSPDWNLLTIKDMKFLFPDAEVHVERSLGMIKSIIAVKKDSDTKD